jgi:hypothetical protein
MLVACPKAADDLRISIPSIKLAIGFALVQQGHPTPLSQRGRLPTISLLIFEAG